MDKDMVSSPFSLCLLVVLKGNHKEHNLGGVPKEQDLASSLPRDFLNLLHREPQSE